MCANWYEYTVKKRIIPTNSVASAFWLSESNIALLTNGVDAATVNILFLWLLLDGILRYLSVFIYSQTVANNNNIFLIFIAPLL